MKTIFKKLVEDFRETEPRVLSSAVDEFVDFLIENADDVLLSVSKAWIGTCSWKSISFANDVYYGATLSKLITKAINGRHTHDEDKDFELEEFREQIENEVFNFIYLSNKEVE